MPVKAFSRLAALMVAAGLLAGPAAAGPLTIVALGDSLTAGYGLAPGEAFPDQLQAALAARGHDVTVVNAGVSGDTSTGGLSRLDWSVPEEADAVIVALGANDALRGLPPEVTREAMTEIVDRLKERGQAVLVAGMLAPRNLDDSYAAAFEAIYADLGAGEEVVYYPFFLEGVAAEPALNQPDGIHPNAAGVALIVDNILPAVERLIGRLQGDG